MNDSAVPEESALHTNNLWTERINVLRIAAVTNTKIGRSPFDHVEIQSKDELEWIIQKRKWTVGGEVNEGESPDLSGADLSGVDLSYIDLHQVNLTQANLNGAILHGANLDRANMFRVQLHGADLSHAHLNNVELTGSDLSNAVLYRANLNGSMIVTSNLYKANLEFSQLSNTDFTCSDLTDAHLYSANLSDSHLTLSTLKNTDLYSTNLSGVDLFRVNAQGANLSGSNLRGANLTEANLDGTNLQNAFMDAGTSLRDSIITSKTLLAGVIWGEVPLSQIKWPKRPFVGDELLFSSAKSREMRIETCRTIVQAYHGLADTFKAQGILILASYCRLREQYWERQALILERKVLSWIWSSLLNILAGYGEIPSRTATAYFVVVFSFAILYYAISQIIGENLSFLGSIIFSLTSFHGRGFFPGTINSITDPLVVLAALEAVLGLFIESIFVATFSRRFLGD